ncbi:MAG TPA: WYL domain-containing protein, partial [Gammaproteobacteria bacterium]|nr:WYL domain-containing protein [Gammaproteobacteria bacterium]
HLGLLQEALLNNSAISIMRHSTSPSMLAVVHPQGLLFSREGVHLVAIAEEGKLPFQLNIHDIADVRILDQPASSPANFDLDSCLAGITGVKSVLEPSSV